MRQQNAFFLPIGRHVRSTTSRTSVGIEEATHAEGHWQSEPNARVLKDLDQCHGELHEKKQACVNLNMQKMLEERQKAEEFKQMHEQAMWKNLELEEKGQVYHDEQLQKMKENVKKSFHGWRMSASCGSGAHRSVAQRKPVSFIQKMARSIRDTTNKVVASSTNG